MLLFLISCTFDVTFTSEAQKFTGLNIPQMGLELLELSSVKVSRPVTLSRIGCCEG